MTANQLLGILIIAIVIWVFSSYSKQVDEQFKEAYRKTYGREPSEAEVQRHNDDHFEPHGRI